MLYIVLFHVLIKKLESGQHVESVYILNIRTDAIVVVLDVQHKYKRTTTTIINEHQYQLNLEKNTHNIKMKRTIAELIDFVTKTNTKGKFLINFASFIYK